MNSQLSAKFTLWCSRGLFIIICLLTFAMPGLLRWYQTLRPLGRYGAAGDHDRVLLLRSRGAVRAILHGSGWCGIF